MVEKSFKKAQRVNVPKLVKTMLSSQLSFMSGKKDPMKRIISMS